jgi:hypothetical protein
MTKSIRSDAPGLMGALRVPQGTERSPRGPRAPAVPSHAHLTESFAAVNPGDRNRICSDRMGATGERGGAYGRFLELPVPMVLAILWLAGAAIISLGGLAFYLSLWSSLWWVAGA